MRLERVRRKPSVLFTLADWSWPVGAPTVEHDHGAFRSLTGGSFTMAAGIRGSKVATCTEIMQRVRSGVYITMAVRWSGIASWQKRRSILSRSRTVIAKKYLWWITHPGSYRRWIRRLTIPIGDFRAG